MRGRNVVLLLDNASCHHVMFDDLECEGMVYKVRVTESVLVVLLPPNLTSAIQPMGQGVFSTLKAIYRASFIKKKLRDLDAGAESRPLTLLEAVQRITKAWSKVTDVTIRNCFRHSGILSFSQEAESRIN